MSSLINCLAIRSKLICTYAVIMLRKNWMYYLDVIIKEINKLNKYEGEMNFIIKCYNQQNMS